MARNPMTKSDRKRMSSLKRQISKVRQKRNQAMDKINSLQAKQTKLIKRAKARRRA